ncbi:hypothetical protein THRCLA_22214 [Thraustotheca clavata]|uniref:Transmembrane protein n=1 Tax=Thraustotheca clavata TaxID=74557 RepID=A0A1V9Z9W7_9STRA|nr:hypothetical protein THRCLA_22214 [Thraustotheca clavata]
MDVVAYQQSVVNNLVGYGKWLNTTSTYVFDMRTAPKDLLLERQALLASLLLLGFVLGTRGYQFTRAVFGLLMVPVGFAIAGETNVLSPPSLAIGLTFGIVFAVFPAWAIRFWYWVFISRTAERMLPPVDIPNKEIIALALSALLAMLVIEFKESTIRMLTIGITSLAGAILAVTVTSVVMGPMTITVYLLIAFWFYRTQRDTVAKLEGLPSPTEAPKEEKSDKSKKE